MSDQKMKPAWCHGNPGDGRLGGCKSMLSRVVWAPSAGCQSFIYPLFVKFVPISSAAVVDFLGLPLPALPGLHPEQKSQFLGPP